MMPTYTPQRRPSWRGVLAGLLMGLIVVMAMIALASVIAALVPSFNLKGTGIAAGIYTAITALVSAFVAGYFAVKCSAPEALFGDGTDIDPKDATLTGMLTAAAIVALSTILTLNAATNILSTATSAATSAVGTVASTAATAATGVASAGTTAVGAALSQADIDLQAEAQSLYNQVTGEISRSDVEGWVAQNTQNLDDNQVNAATSVVLETVNANREAVQQLDFTSLDTWRNLDDIAQRRLNAIEQSLTGDELITRLQDQGLNQAEAEQVRTEILNEYRTYRSDAEQKLSDARSRADQMLTQAEVKVDQALDTAEEVARKAALYAGLFWLISTLLTFIAAIMGARKAAANYRLDKPIITMGDNVR